MNRNKAFTLIELMLAMSILSILLLSITMLVLQMGKLYTKGTSLKSLNQSAQIISRDVQNTINQSRIDMLKTVTVGANGSGRLCTGNISYVWNIARDTAGNLTRNQYSGADASREIRFIRVSDPNNLLCTITPPATTYPAINYANSREMLPSGQSNFAMYEFTVGRPPTSLVYDQSLRWIVMKVGSTDPSDINASTAECLSGSGGLGDYCAINIFEFTARSGKGL